MHSVGTKTSNEVVKENTRLALPAWGADGSKWQLTPNYCIHRLRKMLSMRSTYGIPGSDGTFVSCISIHLKQDHTLFGVFYGHPLHPFSRAERLLFLLVSACWIFFVSVSVESVKFGYTLSVLLTNGTRYRRFFSSGNGNSGSTFQEASEGLS